MQAAPIPNGMPEGPSPSTRARDALSVGLSPGRQGYPPLTWPFRASRFPTPPSLRERRRSWEPGPGERGRGGQKDQKQKKQEQEQKQDKDKTRQSKEARRKQGRSESKDENKGRS